MLKLSTPRLGFLVLIVILIVGVWLRFYINRGQFFDPADETTYLNYAINLNSAGGISGYPKLISDYLADPSAWDSPPPLRYVHIWFSNLACRVTGKWNYEALVWISVLASLGVFALGAAICWHFGGLSAALIGSILLATMPVSLAMGRRALADMPFNFWALAGTWCYYAMVTGRLKPLVGGLSSILLFSLMLGTKEQGIFLLGALAIWTAWYWRSNLRALGLCLGCLAGAGLVYVAGFVIISQNPQSLWAIYSAMSATIYQSITPYIRDYQSGNAFRYLIDLAILSPLVTFITPVCIAQSKTPAEKFFIWVILIYLASMSLNGVSFNLRYISVVEPMLRIALALWLAQIWSINKRMPQIAILAFLVFNAGFEWHYFNQVFMQARVYDPVTANILSALDFIP